MARSFLVRYLREVYAHAGALYGGLGVSVGLLLLDRFSAWHPDPWMYVLAVAVGVAVVQYRIWKSAGWAYVPEDITATDPAEVWEQFCAEAGIVHEGRLGYQQSIVNLELLE